MPDKNAYRRFHSGINSVAKIHVTTKSHHIGIWSSYFRKSYTKRRTRSRFVKSQKTSIKVQKSLSKKYVATKIPADTTSKTGYIREIFFLQYSHFPP